MGAHLDLESGQPRLHGEEGVDGHRSEVRTWKPMSRKDEWLREGIREVREASSSHLVQQSTGGIGSRASCTKGRGERGGVGLSAGVGVAYCLKKAGASDSREEEKDGKRWR